MNAQRSHLIISDMENGKLLYLVRCIKGLKQSEVARKIGITQQAYSKMERSGMVDRNRLDAILEALEFSREKLIALCQLVNE